MYIFPLCKHVRHLHVTASQTPSAKQIKDILILVHPLSLEAAGRLYLFLQDVPAVARSLMMEQWSEVPLRPHKTLHRQRRRMVVLVPLSVERQELEQLRSVARRSGSGPLARFDVSSDT